MVNNMHGHSLLAVLRPPACGQALSTVTSQKQKKRRQKPLNVGEIWIEWRMTPFSLFLSRVYSMVSVLGAWFLSQCPQRAHTMSVVCCCYYIERLKRSRLTTDATRIPKDHVSNATFWRCCNFTRKGIRVHTLSSDYCRRGIQHRTASITECGSLTDQKERSVRHCTIPSAWSMW